MGNGAALCGLNGMRWKGEIRMRTDFEAYMKQIVSEKIGQGAERTPMFEQDARDQDLLEEIYRESVLQTYRIGKQMESKRRDSSAFEQAFEAKEVSLYSPYPQCRITEHLVEGQLVYQLSYEGMLPLYFEKSPSIMKSKEKLAEWTKYHNAVRDYYVQATVDAVRLKEPLPTFKRAFLYHCHFFSNMALRDLDNRNRSALINAARYARLIDSDDWIHLSTMESGFLDVERKNHIQVFISAHENRMSVVKYVDDLYQNGHVFGVVSVANPGCITRQDKGVP